MRRAVLVICDGHRADMVRPELCPNIAGLAAVSRVFARHAGIFPSATRPSSASIATGCLPRTHGLHGNRMALDTCAGLVLRDAGLPDFREHMRRATGRTLRVPTLAQLLAGHGGTVVCANGSPGSAYLQDPDGFGHVYHRWRSTAPGGDALAQADHVEAPKGAAGDCAMTEHFCEIALRRSRSALGVLWLSEPDATAHKAPLGSPEHVRAIASADRCVGQVAERVEALRAAGDEVLFAVGSDHGHESTAGIVCLAAELAGAGLKAAPHSDDVLIGYSGLGRARLLRGQRRGEGGADRRLPREPPGNRRGPRRRRAQCARPAPRRGLENRLFDGQGRRGQRARGEGDDPCGCGAGGYGRRGRLRASRRTRGLREPPLPDGRGRRLRGRKRERRAELDRRYRADDFAFSRLGTGRDGRAPAAARREKTRASPITLNRRSYHWPERPVAVVCLDGCDPAYLEDGLGRGLLPNLVRLVEAGFLGWARAAVPSFTNPNNISIVTGSPGSLGGK